MLKLPSPLFISRKIIFSLAYFAVTIFTLASSFYLLKSLDPKVLEFANIGKIGYQVFASLPEGGQVLGMKAQAQDGRREVLKDFLQSYRSPLADYAPTFINVADKYNLPWTMLPAIAGKESGFGKVIPFGSYNAWGWGVYTGQKSGVGFNSWEEAIEKVGSGIKLKYFNKGLDTVAKMEASYTPPSFNSGSHSWKNGVEFFMEQIESWR